MCLLLDLDETKKVILSNKIWYTGYKILEVGKGKLHSILYSHIWKSGYNVMNMRGRNRRKYQMDIWLNMDYRHSIESGIHIYRTIKEAKYRMPKNNDGMCKIVQVCGHRDDLIAANKKQMVFTRIYLSSKAYNQALKQKD